MLKHRGITGGSPLLTRGKQLIRRHVRGHHGLTPVHAGKTCLAASPSSRRPAHPHSRGENWPGLKPAQRSPGSPPLTRGKHQPPGISTRNDGLIPAHAGKTSIRHRLRRTSRAHPHSRGENTARMIAAELEAGSSPLTRGKHRAVRRAGRQRGLIPTHAGKAYATDKQSLHNLGSSPLTRGKPSARRGPPPARGLIPTHAGKTPTYGGTTSQPQAHPRSRGENAEGLIDDPYEAGSSLLTRGKQRRVLLPEHCDGFIPTHTGKTVPA